MFNARRLFRFLATGVMPEMTAFDESLVDHDKKYHPDGFKEGDSCKFREERAKVDGVDQVGLEEGEVRMAKCKRLAGGDSRKLSREELSYVRYLKRELKKSKYARRDAAKLYNKLTASSLDETECEKQLPDAIVNWCEDNLTKALLSRDDFSRATDNIGTYDDLLAYVKMQVARDLQKKGNDDSKATSEARSQVQLYERVNLYRRSRMEAEGTWTEDQKDKPKLNARRLLAIKEKFNEGLGSFEDHAYDKDRKIAIFKALDNAPYEFVRSLYLTKPLFHFVNGDEGLSDDNGNITIGFGEWSFNGETVAHESGHTVLEHKGQGARSEVQPEFEPIVNALAEDYKALNIFDVSPVLHNDNINTPRDYADARNDVKRIALLRTMDAPDFDAMVDANGEKALKVSDTEVHEYATIADTLCAATNGIFFCGHSRRYYQSGEAMPLHETVANASAALVMGWKTFPKVFPRTFAAVKKIVYGIND